MIDGKILRKHVTSNLAPAEEKIVAAHVSTCAECQEEIGRLERRFEAIKAGFRSTLNNGWEEKQSRGSRESIIEMVEIDLAGFYGKIHRSAGLRLEVPPGHVTLMTKGDPMGIGVDSEEALAEYTVEVLS